MFHKHIRHILFLCFFLQSGILYSQCNIVVDTLNLGHVSCPDGGATGSANILQTGYQNFSWINISNGQIYGNGPGITSLSNLDKGVYVVQGSNPYNSSCSYISYSDTFEILEPTPDIVFTPTQACPGLCNVIINIELLNSINGVNYLLSLDNSSPVLVGTAFPNQCGGSHQYEIFADGLSCGIESFGVSQFAQMNLSTTVNNLNCSQLGSAIVNITGVGASGLNTYCISEPQFNNYSTIDNVQLIGDNTSIINNTSGQCDSYQDYTSTHSADLTPGNQYAININLGTCYSLSPLVDIANVYIDWNIDGDFDDLYELVGQIPPTQSPSLHTINFNVPSGAIPGQSRMRIVSQNSQYQVYNQALSCDYQTAWFGSTEDYTIVVNGSVANPVSYLWSNGQTSQTASNLTVGSYTVTITDANGCTANDTALVDGVDSLTSMITPVLQTVCRNELSDSLIITSSGDSGPYQYQWLGYPFGTQANQASIIPNANDSFLIPSTSNIGLQFFYAIVTSGTGCIDTTNIISFETVTSPKIIEEPQDTNVCINANITINIEDTFFVNVAANIITPIYQWYQNSICSVIGAVPALGPGNNTITYTPQTALPGTTYYYCVVNIPQIVGCSSDTSDCAEIIVNPTPTVALTALPSPACEGDDIVLTAVASTGLSCVTSCHEVDVVINTDANGSEISWDITDNAGVIFASGGSYANGVNTYTSIACLPSGIQLDFNWYDSQGDGWNDGVNQGSFSVIQGTATLTQGSPSSGSSGSATFSITSSTSSCTSSSPSLIPYQYRFMYNDGTGWQNILTNTPWGWGTANPISSSSINNITQFRVRVREHWGCNTSAWSPIITVPINTIVTPPISHN